MDKKSGIVYDIISIWQVQEIENILKNKMQIWIPC